MNTQEEVLKKLSTMRKKKGISKETLSQAIGCGAGEYVKKEKGKAPISTGEWIRIAESMSVPVCAFFSNVSTESAKDSNILLHGYNRLSTKGRTAIMALLNAFLRAQWSGAKVSRKPRVKARASSGRTASRRSAA
ncbi:MAG: helix-turn-helix transcriptional regulator [Deltaproteobacteria bacterium]|nr:helix-turn-helix transcriptional regulator [Deltaproteobacteria bacterium]